jgi:MSHA pilin protein MshD
MCITRPGSRLPLVTSRRQRGLSMIELIFAIVIVSVGLVALLIPIISAVKNSADPVITKQMVAVAEATMEEIELMPFTGTFGGPYTQANRPQFDAVPDYNNFSTAGIFTIDNPAAPIAGLASYNLNVSVTGTALGALPPAQAYLISVTVTGPNGSTLTLSGFRTSYY